MNRYRLIQGLTWLISLVLLVWVSRGLPLSSILKTVSELSFYQWFVWSLLNLLIILVYVQRWRCLSDAAGLDIDFSSLFMLRQAGQFISFITPGPQFGGEPFQVYWLWKKNLSSGTLALLSVALDRFYELWINFAILLLGLLIVMLSPALGLADWPSLAVAIILIIILLSCSAWFLLSHQQKLSVWIKRLAERWQHNPRLSRLESHWDELGKRIGSLFRNEKRALGTALALSLAGWAGMIIEIWLLLWFFDIAPGFTGLVLLLVAMRLAFLLPLPGGLGTLEAAVFWTFTGLGLPMTGAVAVIAMMRLRDIIVLGIGFLALVNLRDARLPEDITVGGKK